MRLISIAALALLFVGCTKVPEDHWDPKFEKGDRVVVVNRDIEHLWLEHGVIKNGTRWNRHEPGLFVLVGNQWRYIVEFDFGENSVRDREHFIWQRDLELASKFQPEREEE